MTIDHVRYICTQIKYKCTIYIIWRVAQHEWTTRESYYSTHTKKPICYPPAPPALHFHALIRGVGGKLDRFLKMASYVKS